MSESRVGKILVCAPLPAACESVVRASDRLRLSMVPTSAEVDGASTRWDDDALDDATSEVEALSASRVSLELVSPRNASTLPSSAAFGCLMVARYVSPSMLIVALSTVTVKKQLYAPGLALGLGLVYRFRVEVWGMIRIDSHSRDPVVCGRMVDGGGWWTVSECVVGGGRRCKTALEVHSLACRCLPEYVHAESKTTGSVKVMLRV